jgi:hypothetical protein
MVQVVLSRCLGAPDGYDLAIVSTDLVATPQALIERYADRWPIETMFLQARHLVGVGQAPRRNLRHWRRWIVVPMASTVPPIIGSGVSERRTPICGCSPGSRWPMPTSTAKA